MYEEDEESFNFFVIVMRMISGTAYWTVRPRAHDITDLEICC